MLPGVRTAGHRLWKRNLGANHHDEKAQRIRL
jgi:hypothetical protein